MSKNEIMLSGTVLGIRKLKNSTLTTIAVTCNINGNQKYYYPTISWPQEQRDKVKDLRWYDRVFIKAELQTRVLKRKGEISRAQEIIGTSIEKESAASQELTNTMELVGTVGNIRTNKNGCTSMNVYLDSNEVQPARNIDGSYIYKEGLNGKKKKVYEAVSYTPIVIAFEDTAKYIQDNIQNGDQVHIKGYISTMSESKLEELKQKMDKFITRESFVCNSIELIEGQ